MRHSYIPFIIIAGIALLSSCARVSEIEQPTEAQKGTYTYTLSAGSQDTKTSYDAEGHFSWTAGDAISVLFHNGETNKFFTLTTSNSGALASFTGEIEKGYEIGASTGNSFDKKIWALFPASDYHTYTAANDSVSFYVQPEVDFTTTHESANIPMYDLVASEEGELYFKNLASTYKFVVNGIKDGVSKVRFTVYNKTTFGLSGIWAIRYDDKYFVNYGYANPGVSEKSFLTYVSNVADGSASFYVSCHGTYGTFQPYITITNVATGVTIKSFDAAVAKSLNDVLTVPVITLDVSVENGGDYFEPEIKIDDSIDDWEDVPHVFAPANDTHIKEWKYTKDSRNLYILYKVPTTDMSASNYIYVGVDTDNNSETGGNASGNLGSGMEYYTWFKPWINDGGIRNLNGVPELEFKHYNSDGKAWESASNSLIVGGGTVDSYNYVEVQIPLADIGSPSGQIRISHSFGWDNIGSTRIMPETATLTVTASDNETVGIGKTLSLGAATNSSATITYESSDTDVATVDANGVVTGKATGTATITASVAAVSGEYTAASKSINVSVPLIMIDGNMSDWSEISGTSYSNYTSFKVASDEWNLYFYAYRSASTSSYWKIWGERIGYIYVGLDTDNNASTPEGDGYTLNGNGPYEYVAFIYPYGGTAGKEANSYQDAVPAIATSFGSSGQALPSPYTTTNVRGSGVIDASGVAVEFSIPRTDLPTIPNTPITVKSWGNKDLSMVTISCTL